MTRILLGLALVVWLVVGIAGCQQKEEKNDFPKMHKSSSSEDGGGGESATSD
jgi:hypothetical protein